MDCRTFHRRLEDYLEDSLDFAGRFGMERHAQQCIGCGKELANAQRLRRMVSGLKPVKAPPDFEASVINEIGRRELEARSSGIRRFWIYGLSWPSWRKLALASSSLAILGLGMFFSLRLTTPGNPDSASRLTTEKQEIVPVSRVNAKSNTNESADHSASPVRIKAETSKVVQAPQPAVPPQWEYVPEQEAADAEYVEHMVVGADGRPVTIQLPMPRKIRMQYHQMSEEYFIQNVSH
jgi:hypothetical protein